MNVEVVPGRNLAPELVARWVDLQAADARFVSPYFRPEFTQAVAAVRDDVFVGVLSEGGVVRGFLPFQRTGRTTGGPVGGAMSNYQGVLVEPGTTWSARKLVRGLGLTVLDFDHLICTQPELEPFHAHVEGSKVIDTAQGFEAWIESRHRNKKRSAVQVPRHIRKLECELGPVRFEPHVADDDVFHTLVRWKRAQYLRTGARGSMTFDWAVEALGHIAREQKDGFSGMLSALYAGDRLVAAHMGMRSRTVWHCWYPAYDPEHAEYRPGLVLFWKMIEYAASNAIEWIDLGKGGEQFKRSFCTRSIDVAEGSVTLPSVSGDIHRIRARAVHFLRTAPKLDPARRVFRVLRGSARRRVS